MPLCAVPQIHNFPQFLTKAFIEGLQGGLENLELYTHEEMHMIAKQQLELKRNVERIERLHRNGELSTEEYESLLKQKKKALSEKEVEMAATIGSNNKTYDTGLKVIELLKKSSNFMLFHKDRLEKARLVKMVLSNPKLEDGTVRFDYQKPFDVCGVPTSST